MSGSCAWYNTFQEPAVSSIVKSLWQDSINLKEHNFIGTATKASSSSEIEEQDLNQLILNKALYLDLFSCM